MFNMLHFCVFRTVLAISCAGILYALFLLAWIRRHRDEPMIRASSPRVNNVILIGALFCYVGAILFGLDAATVEPEQFSRLCQLRLWIFSLGFTLVFGALFAKTLRVHLIFNNSAHQSVMVSDIEVFGYIGAMLSCDVVILLVWQLVDPLTVAFTQTTPEPINFDLIIQSRIQHCSCQNFVGFLAALLLYKGLIICVGAYLAFTTRKVTLPAFNDSQYIGLCIYTLTICAVATVPVIYLIGDRPNIAFALTGFPICFGTTSTLSILFLPKVIVVWNGEQDTFMRDSKSPSSNSGSSSNSSSSLRSSLRQNTNLSISPDMYRQNSMESNAANGGSVSGNSTTSAAPPPPSPALRPSSPASIELSSSI